jgi:hypothetical protein
VDIPEVITRLRWWILRRRFRTGRLSNRAMKRYLKDVERWLSERHDVS